MKRSNLKFPTNRSSIKSVESPEMTFSTKSIRSKHFANGKPLRDSPNEICSLSRISRQRVAVVSAFSSSLRWNTSRVRNQSTSLSRFDHPPWKPRESSRRTTTNCSCGRNDSSPRCVCHRHGFIEENCKTRRMQYDWTIRDSLRGLHSLVYLLCIVSSLQKNDDVYCESLLLSMTGGREF